MERRKDTISTLIQSNLHEAEAVVDALRHAKTVETRGHLARITFADGSILGFAVSDVFTGCPDCFSGMDFHEVGCRQRYLQDLRGQLEKGALTVHDIERLLAEMKEVEK